MRDKKQQLSRRKPGRQSRAGSKGTPGSSVLLSARVQAASRGPRGLSHYEKMVPTGTLHVRGQTLQAEEENRRNNVGGESKVGSVLCMTFHLAM